MYRQSSHCPIHYSLPPPPTPPPPRPPPSLPPSFRSLIHTSLIYSSIHASIHQSIRLSIHPCVSTRGTRWLVDYSVYCDPQSIGASLCRAHVSNGNSNCKFI